MPLDRRELILLGALSGVGLATHRGGLPEGRSGAGAASAASGLYGRALVFDGCGSPGDNESDAEKGVPLSARAVSDARTSGVTAVNVTVGPVGNRPDAAAFEGIVRDVAYWEREIEAHPDAFVKVKTTRDLDGAKESRRLGLAFGLQDGVAFAGDLSRLETLHALGVRIIQPTYNLRNLLGDGCLEPGDAGLSRLGHEAVARMDALRILIDLSHCGRRTTREVLAASARPVAVTHTGCAAIADHPRNKTDEELRLLAKNGGVAGIYFMPYLRTSGQPMAVDVLRHLEHALDVAGEDHVGIGTDGTISAVELTPKYLEEFRKELAARRKAGIGAPGEIEDVYTFVPDLNTPRRLETLAGLLLARGHTASRVEKLLGGNFARLLRDVWG
ncbi:MAG: dipeptidase [Acidithiobacillales bacterium]